jgi:hypothetical protein
MLFSSEDRTGRALYEQPLAVDRIKAAHEAIACSGHDVVLVGRSEGYLIGRTELGETISIRYVTDNRRLAVLDHRRRAHPMRRCKRSFQSLLNVLASMY